MVAGFEGAKKRKMFNHGFLFCKSAPVVEE